MDRLFIGNTNKIENLHDGVEYVITQPALDIYGKKLSSEWYKVNAKDDANFKKYNLIK